MGLFGDYGIPGQSAPASLKHSKMSLQEFAQYLSIPGQSAPASLKQERYFDIAKPLLRMHSGAVCPGLIEANLNFHPFCETGKQHSGAVCPGLIEAMRQRKDNEDGQSIPGQSAPASLKQRGWRSGKHGRSVHSGAVCPGLIEARMIWHHPKLPE